jgi:4-amino-4-deoxy-L-arabinose transferase-like glycosyltransferase
MQAHAPQSLRECGPFVWSRLLFPGAPETAGPRQWPALLLLVVLPGVLLYPCLSFYLFEPDEGRYAQIPREMLQRGDWVVPHLFGEPYLDKPPLFYWLVMLSYAAFGSHDWSARLVPALAIHAAVLLTYLLGRRSLGGRTAFWGALLLALAPGFLGMGRLLILDGLLALWVTLALFAAFEAVRAGPLRWRWWLLAAAACGLGVLTKGPVILLLVLPPWWLYRRLTVGAAAVSWRAAAAFAAVVLALPLPWYVAVCVRSPAFAAHFFWEHNVLRFLAPFDHLEPVWFYGPILLWGLLPATLLAWPLLRFLAGGAAAPRRCPALGFVLLAGGWCVLFFSLSGCKLPTYVLPAFPPLALALGRFLTATPWGRGPRLAGLVALGLAVQVASHYVVVPWYADYRSPAGQWSQIAGRCGDRDTPVVCYPRTAHSVAFYLDRDDVRTYRSKEIAQLLQDLRSRPRTVVLCTHRHSLRALRQFLPADLRVADETHFGLRLPTLTDAVAKQVNQRMGETALGLCDMVVIERVSGARPAEMGDAVEAEEP